MSERKETVFANGMFIQPRKPNTPDFVLGTFSFKVDEFINTLNQYRNNAGYVNVIMKRSQSGKPYLEIDTWGLDNPASRPATPAAPAPAPAPAPFNGQF